MLMIHLQSYMEDHLRNKDRLETEWAALCAYEADPCATTIAQRVSISPKFGGCSFSRFVTIIIIHLTLTGDCESSHLHLNIV